MLESKLRSIKKGCRLCDRILARITKNAGARAFKTERDIARFIKSELGKAGAGLAFPPIVAVGKNAVEWHHKPTNAKLHGSGFCVIDFGARINGYCSDITRTLYFGRATKGEKRVYAKVRKANEKCISRIMEGANGIELYNFARKLLGGHAKYFGHGLGHGLGKRIHQKPFMKKKKKHILHAGDIVTIEPGVYIPRKLGIRIEDDVLVTRNGGKALTRSTRNLIEIR